VNEIDCPPYVVPSSGDDASILALAARASHAVDVYRATVDARKGFDETIRAARQLAIVTQCLTSAIADAVACGDNRLS
jgi:hypothetical protein